MKKHYSGSNEPNLAEKLKMSDEKLLNLKAAMRAQELLTCFKNQNTLRILHGETGFLVLDDALNASKKLAKLFGQDAFIWMSGPCTPEVVEV